MAESNDPVAGQMQPISREKLKELQAAGQAGASEFDPDDLAAVKTQMKDLNMSVTQNVTVAANGPVYIDREAIRDLEDKKALRQLEDKEEQERNQE